MSIGDEAHDLISSTGSSHTIPSHKQDQAHVLTLDIWLMHTLSPPPKILCVREEQTTVQLACNKHIHICRSIRFQTILLKGNHIKSGIRNWLAPGIKDFCIWQLRVKSRMTVNDKFDIFAICGSASITRYKVCQWLGLELPRKMSAM
jgi:hypothetical protein